MRAPSLLFGAQEAHGIRGNTPTVINPWIILEYAKRFCSFTVNIFSHWDRFLGMMTARLRYLLPLHQIIDNVLNVRC